MTLPSKKTNCRNPTWWRDVKLLQRRGQFIPGGHFCQRWHGVSRVSRSNYSTYAHVVNAIESPRTLRGWRFGWRLWSSRQNTPRHDHFHITVLSYTCFPVEHHGPLKTSIIMMHLLPFSSNVESERRFSWVWYDTVQFGSRSLLAIVRTVLQLPLIEVGNAMRAYCYSTASYP